MAPCFLGAFKRVFWALILSEEPRPPTETQLSDTRQRVSLYNAFDKHRFDPLPGAAKQADSKTQLQEASHQAPLPPSLVCLISD